MPVYDYWDNEIVVEDTVKYLPDGENYTVTEIKEERNVMCSLSNGEQVYAKECEKV